MCLVFTVHVLDEFTDDPVVQAALPWQAPPPVVLFLKFSNPVGVARARSVHFLSVSAWSATCTVSTVIVNASHQGFMCLAFAA